MNRTLKRTLALALALIFTFMLAASALARKQHVGSQPGGYRNTRLRRTGKRGQHHHYSQRRNDFRNAHLYSRYRHERKRRSRDA